MAPRIKWTEAAWEDLDSAAEYVSRDSPRYAAAFVRRVLDTVKSLGQFPRRGHMVPELDTTDIRELLVYNHRLIYHVGPEAIHILGVIHGARDLAALWQREHREEGLL